jgi:3-methyladenine DNA glycosylase/8-oxoguanine DNA glycosylase
VPLLRLPQPYDFELSTERFRVFGPDLANFWHDDALHRVIDGREVRMRAASGGVQVTALSRRTEPVLTKLLGAEFDLTAFATFAAGEPVLSKIEPALRGFRPPLAPDPFESLVTSITAQQVSLFAAFAIRNRLIARFGTQAGHAYSFPTAERLAGADDGELVALGFSRRKAAYVLALARSELDLVGLASLPDDMVKAELQALPGIGEWTADWFLGRHLARPQAWPAGDLGLRKAVSAFYAGGRPLSTEEVRAMGDRFEPFQNLSAHYLLTGARRLL